MKCLQIVVLFVLFLVVLVCDATEKFWCKFTENGRQVYGIGFYCDTTAADMGSYQQQQQHQHQFNRTNCVQFTQMQPNVTFVTHLKFHECDFKFIDQQCKSAMYLNAIDISHSNYDRLNFDGYLFDHLKVLNASHNRLHEVPSIIFSRMPKITEIDLSNNNLTVINDTAFTILIHLQSINLSGNQIQTLETLQNNRRLQTIQATENPISSFDCDHFTKMDTISVAISWNRIKKLNLACKKCNFRVISNGTAELVVLHHSTQLSLANDSEIHCTAGSMTHIDSCTIAGRNKFKNITQLLVCFGAKIKRLALSGNALDRAATTSTFRRFTELEWLSLKDNVLNEFDFRAIQHQTNLLRLDLSQNDLKELKNPSLLLRFNLLREFKVAGNQIQNSHEIIANLRESLKWLDLSDNFVGLVNASTFQHLEFLTTLKLSNTSLMVLDDQNPFYAIKNLSIFDVSQNNLSAVQFNHWASTLGQLTRFFATNCQLTNVSNVIRYLGEQQLLEIDLSGNDFSGENFTVNTFKRLAKLQYLHLNAVNLRTFDFDWLKNNREIRAVKLSDNKLQSIKMMTTAMVNLKRLDLGGNDLIHLDGLKRSIVPQLEYLSISKNNFECDYLIQLQQILANVKLIGDPLQHQKHGENCYLNKNSIQTKMGMNERKKYAIGVLIVIVILSMILLVVTSFFCCRKPKLSRSEETLKRIRQSMRESEYFVPNFQIPDDDCDEHYDMNAYQDDSNNDVYDEISLGKHHDYDHLHFDTDPMPFGDDDNDENYLHIGLINGQISSRNVTSRL